GINMNVDRCNDCRRCEQVCDMGIPVWEQGKLNGRVTAIEDCMGCARCVVSCPTDALEIHDVRNLFRPDLKQNASHLLRRQPNESVSRQVAINRRAEIRKQDWGEIKIMPTLSQIQAQAKRCLDCGVPGCMNACPLSNRIPEWLEAAAKGEIKEAAEIAHATSNLPEVCGRLCPQQRLCEGSCTKAREPGGAVTIGEIEQYIVDEAFLQGWCPRPPVRRNGKKIAVIGAGPAGLACADELNKAGCQVTVYDKQPIVGGLMASGVPPFKLDKGILVYRQSLLAQHGIDFCLGEEINRQGLADILDAYDAVFLGTGAQVSREPVFTGKHLSGYMTALDYLSRVNQEFGGTELAGKSVLVLGGGDSAMDCARAAMRQGAKNVTVACRNTLSDMRASEKERQAASEEGVDFIFQVTPEEMLGEESVCGVQFKTSLDVSKTIECDVVISAIGQIAEPIQWLSGLGVVTDSNWFILTDEQGCTSNKKIFAGGDNTHGPDLVVTAIAAGRRAAYGIVKSFSTTHHFLTMATSLLPLSNKHTYQQVEEDVKRSAQ
ncbi:MAG: FAD-dependent oxidoreductase, partial [Gammaproteobacteria bacterium]|nr:FAD-dependent oxidoreductase [Gammaproteobacteria bacterium]